MCGNPLNNCGCSQPCNCSSVSCLQVKTFNAATSVNLSTDVITITNHDFLTGQKVLYTAVGGAAPTGLVTNTDYFIIKISANTFKLATTLANSINGIAINITAVGVGTAHILTAYNCTTPAPCLEGCLTDTRTNCTFLSEDLDICTNILPKGSTVTQALKDLAAAVCNGVVITTQDVKVKIDANDTTNGYLFDKITTCSNLTKTVTNVNNNETLQLCAKIDTLTPGGNALSSGPNGLYVAPPIPSSSILTPLFSTSVSLTVTPVVGGNNILADIKKDTTTGANNNILQVGLNGVYVPPNTPISVVLPASSGLNLTATGTNNHTLTASVKLDTVSGAGNNILALGPNGLYVPPSSGSGSSITINSTNTILSQLSGSVYSLSVIRSTDPGQGLVLDSNGNLYVNDIEEPNSLGFILANNTAIPPVNTIYFEFQGPSLLSTDYEVQVQGDPASPYTWLPATFFSITSGVLRYTVGALNTNNLRRARVRTKVGTVPANTRYSNWVGKTFDYPFKLVSNSGTISISAASSGINNQFSVDINSPNCINDFSATLEIIQFGINYFLRVTRVISSIQNSDTFSLKVSSPSLLNANVGGGTISSEPLVFIPITYIPGNTYEVSVTKHCTYSTTQSNNIVIPITLLPTVCTTDGYIDVPTGSISGFIFALQTVSATTPTNSSKLKYMITNDLYKNYLEFSGVIRLTSTVPITTTDTGWKPIINVSGFASCTTSTPNIYKLGNQEDISTTGTSSNYDYDADAIGTYRSYNYLIRRNGNLIEIRLPNYNGGASNVLDTYVNLSGLKL